MASPRLSIDGFRAFRSAASSAALLVLVWLVPACRRTSVNVTYYGVAERIECEDLVWIEIVPTVFGESWPSANVAASGHDLSMPWVGELDQVHANGADINLDRGQLPTRFFLAPSGIQLALAAFDTKWGLAEKTWIVPPADQSRGRLGNRPHQIHVPLGSAAAPPQMGTVEWIHRSGWSAEAIRQRSPEFRDKRRFELRSPQFGLLLAHYLVSEAPGTQHIAKTWNLPAGDYRILVTAPPQSSTCGTGSPTSHRFLTHQHAIRLKPAEHRRLTTEDVPGSPLRFEPTWKPGQEPPPTEQSSLPGTLHFLYPAYGKPGLTVKLRSTAGDFPTETTLLLSGFGLNVTGFYPSTPVGVCAQSRRAFPAGAYEVRITGAGARDTNVQLQVLPGDVRCRVAEGGGVRVIELEARR